MLINSFHFRKIKRANCCTPLDLKTLLVTSSSSAACHTSKISKQKTDGAKQTKPCFTVGGQIKSVKT